LAAPSFEEDFLYPKIEGDPYEILERIGEGTFSVVWHARDRATGEEVALKVVTPLSAPHRTLNETELLLKYGYPI
jgi:serine/threonine protein kinase